MTTPLLAPSPPAPAAPASLPPGSRDFPLRIDSGPWRAGHVQGVAVDQEGGFIYFSFTTMLLKTDFSGAVIGSVTGLTGHLGDIDFNPDDGRVYGSLEYKAAESFYVAVFDVDAVTRQEMDADGDGVLTTVYLKEVVDDFTATVGEHGGRPGRKHRYGCSGIDGIAFGPSPGDPGGPRHLMVAYGVYSDTTRTDNDHQVLLQYDIGKWPGHERPMLQQHPHTSGPSEPAGKFFVFTGNTRFGVQNLKYDPHTGNWFLGVYRGAKAEFPNYGLFMVDGAAVPDAAYGTGGGQALRLHPSGLYDAGSGIHGWDFTADVGLESLGGGYYYVSEHTRSAEAGWVGYSSTLRLHRWTGEAPAPFEPVTGR